MNESPSLIAGRILADCCKKLIPGQNDESLLKTLQSLLPAYPVRLSWIGEEWYRIGGVVDRDGQRIAHDLIEWSERTYIECGRDLQTLVDHARERNLIATRQSGRSLYFVVQTGSRAEDFTLIEIDKTREVYDRLLVNENEAPEDLDEIIDPLNPTTVESVSVGATRYAYRRKTDMPLFIEAIDQHHAVEHPVRRFLDDWNRSSAGQKHRFCEDWLIRPSQHTGRFGEQIVNAEIINIRQNRLPYLEDLAGKKGNTLNGLLTRFDRQAGYPFAWFFYMVKGKLVSPYCAQAVFQDISGDFAYLPQRDEAVLRDWVADPYQV
ncbi:hypothetical protein [Methylotuvimicrobium buryatense]|uniref:Uncharacterized protein n=1 Tax=Methylotuvimicrobium buryatense TaxID=95641 RepID=A0A4P9UQQ0_METBY|nr:hypothetical protein [Methylotuvimicrobium buryatense]QCW83774.1 hypothetical protein EQU24_17105 [Methylotuvimicrobium buryatense]